MANLDHLAKLEEGVETWNQWRGEHRDIQPDLQEADLSGADLSGADLGWANLQKAYLREANLQKATLVGADLSGAYLLLANLQKANLGGANLQEAILLLADLQEAILREANLQKATLLRANLQKAYLQRALFDAGTNLSDVILGDEQSVGASVADLNWGEANLAVVDWTQVKVLGDEYEAQQPKTQRGERKTKLGRVGDYRTAVRANRQLSVVLRDQGLNEEADYFAYRAQRLQRIVLRRQGLLPNEKGRRKTTIWQRVRKLSAYAFSGFLDLLAGYGYRPGRTLFWYLFVITAFTTAYAVFGPLPPVPDALVFSFMSFHGRGFFPSLSGETNLHNPLVVLAAAEAVTGLFIEISFIATFTQRFFGR